MLCLTSGVFQYIFAVIVNRSGQLEQTVEQLEAILVAEKSKVTRRLNNTTST